MKWASALLQIADVYEAIVLSLAFASLKRTMALSWGSRPRLYAYACLRRLVCRAEPNSIKVARELSAPPGLVAPDRRPY